MLPSNKDDNPADDKPCCDSQAEANTNKPSKSAEALRIEEYKKRQMTESRMLTCFQILLTIACMCAYTMVFDQMGWLTEIDVDRVAQHPPTGVNSVNSLPEAFIIDKKSGAMS